MESSETPVPYRGRTVPKGETNCSGSLPYSYPTHKEKRRSVAPACSNTLE